LEQLELARDIQYQQLNIADGEIEKAKLKLAITKSDRDIAAEKLRKH
jgi:hypothetical protein